MGDSLEFHYQKTQQYSVLHVDGCIGGPTPRGILSLSFFSERSAIPRIGRRTILAQDEGQVTAGPEEVTDSLDGIVRQIDTTVMMDLRTAQELHQFLGEQIALMQNIDDVKDSGVTTAS